MSDNPYLKGKVPARYVGEHEVVLSPFGRPYFDADGKPRSNLRLRTGDTLYIYESEARGESWLHDPKREKPSVHLGTGKRIPDKEQYQGKSEEELRELGWDYHAKRRDFEEIVLAPQAEEKPVQIAPASTQGDFEEIVSTVEQSPQIAPTSTQQDGT